MFNRIGLSKRRILTGRQYQGTHRRKRLAFELLEERQLLVGDSVEVLDHPPSAAVADDYSVNYSLEIAADANIVNRVQVGDEFSVRLYVEHVSANPKGVFAAFADVHFDPTLVEIKGRIAFHGPYQSVVSGMSRPGLVDEVGGLAGIYAIGGGRHLVAEIYFEAIADGTVEFQLSPADDDVQHPTLVYSMNTETPPRNISYQNAVLNVGSGVPADTQHSITVAKDNAEQSAGTSPAHWNGDRQTTGGPDTLGRSDPIQHVHFEFNREPTSLLNSAAVINALPPAAEDLGGIVANRSSDRGHNLSLNILKRPIRTIDADGHFVEIARRTEKLEVAGVDDQVRGVIQGYSIHATAFAESMSRNEALTAADTVHQGQLGSGASIFKYDAGRLTVQTAADRRAVVDYKFIIDADTSSGIAKFDDIYVSRDEAPSTESRALTSEDDLQAVLLHNSVVGFEDSKWTHRSSRENGWRTMQLIHEKAFQLTADETETATLEPLELPNLLR